MTIVHEDAVAGMEAMDVLERMAARLGTKLGQDINPWQFYTHVWKFEWLQDPALWVEAVTWSVKADMIILASGIHRELPTSVHSWIESVLPLKQAVSAALVALLNGPGENRPGAMPPARYLRHLADRYGMGFFCNLDDAPERVESGMEAVLLRFAGGLLHSPPAPA